MVNHTEFIEMITHINWTSLLEKDAFTSVELKFCKPHIQRPQLRLYKQIVIVNGLI